MKNKFLLIALLFIVGLFAYGEYSPSAKSIGHKIEQMEIGLKTISIVPLDLLTIIR